jgi:hypothetical protein
MTKKWKRVDDTADIDDYKQLIKEMKKNKIVKNLTEWEKQNGKKFSNLEKQINIVLKSLSENRNLRIKLLETIVKLKFRLEMEKHFRKIDQNKLEIKGII